MRKGKLRRNRLDERQEQKMLQIEHNGCWIAFWGLAISLLWGAVWDWNGEIWWENGSSLWVCLFTL